MSTSQFGEAFNYVLAKVREDKKKLKWYQKISWVLIGIIAGIFIAGFVTGIIIASF